MTLTDAEILDQTATRYRRDRWRWELTDQRGDTVLGTLTPSRATPPRMTNDAGSRLGRRLDSLVLLPSEMSDIDPVSTALRPVLILENGSEYPKGLFRWAGLPHDEHSWGRRRDAQLVDRTTILDQEIKRTLSWKRGTQITTALDQVLGEVLDEDQYAITASPEILFAPETFPIGTSRITVAADLIEKLGYLPIHFDDHGIGRARPVPDPNLTAPQVIYTPGSRVQAGSRSGSDTLLDTPEEFIVYETSGNGTGIRGRFKVPDSAPHSEARRGYPVPRTLGVQGLATYSQANLMAAALAITEGRSYEFKSFRAPWDPRHDQWTIVEFYGSRWLEQSWSGVCSPTGLQEHLIRQVYTESWVPPS